MNIQADSALPQPAAPLTAGRANSSMSDAKYPSQSESLIYVADDFKVKEGAKLTENLYIGKPLGVGLQV